MKKRTVFLFAMLMGMLGTNALAHNIAVANDDGLAIYYVWTNNQTELSVNYQGNYYDSYSNE